MHIYYETMIKPPSYLGIDITLGTLLSFPSVPTTERARPLTFYSFAVYFKVTISPLLIRSGSNNEDHSGMLVKPIPATSS